ncbi:hypothetical protein, partial [Klebsiella pneumoniae]|uniref:hypothetical protein n=1 Tax=Klebsiella pneumoniae TaxID=573 RepID=UPI001953E58B
HQDTGGGISFDDVTAHARRHRRANKKLYHVSSTRYVFALRRIVIAKYALTLHKSSVSLHDLHQGNGGKLSRETPILTRAVK